jgi:caa(3)-type oxidase subunit IV
MSEHAHPSYFKIYFILLALLFVSIMGPFIGIWWVTLITAFGIACVKAFLVAKHFMHLNVQPKFALYLLATVLVFVLLFFAGAAPDVMQHEGANWSKPDWAAELQGLERALSEKPHS